MRETARWVCLASWCIALTLELYYLYIGGVSGRVLLGTVDVSHSIRVGQAQGVAWHLIGIASAALVFLVRRGWRLVLLIFSCLTYLVVWYLNGSLRRLGVVNGYHMHWYSARLLHYEMAFFIRDVILPLAFVGALVVGIIEFSKCRAVAPRS